MRINFDTISHRHQRYPTVGDYFLKKGVLHFHISRMKDKRYAALVFLHEIVEYFICRLQGVKLRDIDRFDMEYEKRRTAIEKDIGRFNYAPCGCEIQDEPGNDPHSPYHRAHQTATACEKLIADALGVSWTEYDKTVESL